MPAARHCRPISFIASMSGSSAARGRGWIMTSSMCAALRSSSGSRSAAAVSSVTGMLTGTRSLIAPSAPDTGARPSARTPPRDPRLVTPWPPRDTPPRMALTLDLPDEAATGALGVRLAAALRPGDAVLLDGPLGAGKSALARATLRAAAGDPGLEVPSPSFTLVQTYDLSHRPLGGPAHHLDLYRLDGPAGVRELGWEEAREGIVLVEWPDRLGDLAPADALRVALAFGARPEARTATLSGWPDQRVRALAP